MENSNRGANCSYNGAASAPPLIPHFCSFVPPCCSPSQGARRARSASPTVPPIDTWEAPHERETPGSDPCPRRGGVSFTPASRDYSNVTANQTAQNYTASSTTTLSASPTSEYVNGTVTATWSGTAGPSGA